MGARCYYSICACHCWLDDIQTAKEVVYLWCRSLLVNDRLCPRVSRGHLSFQMYLVLNNQCDNKNIIKDFAIDNKNLIFVLSLRQELL